MLASAVGDAARFLRRECGHYYVGRSLSVSKRYQEPHHAPELLHADDELSKSPKFPAILREPWLFRFKLHSIDNRMPPSATASGSQESTFLLDTTLAGVENAAQLRQMLEKSGISAVERCRASTTRTRAGTDTPMATGSGSARWMQHVEYEDRERDATAGATKVEGDPIAKVQMEFRRS